MAVVGLFAAIVLAIIVRDALAGRSAPTLSKDEADRYWWSIR